MKIGTLDLTERVVIVAEIGNNHEGNFEVACELVRQAAACGVDAVKFQTFKTEQFIRPVDTARFQRLQSFELTIEQFSQLANLAKSLGLLFISTPLDLESAQGLEPLVDAYKIASCDDTFYPLLSTVAKTGKPVIFSTGISDWEQVQKTVHYLKSIWEVEKISNPCLTVLHCVSSYPVPPEQANLNSIRFLQDHLDCPIGYSDHVIGLDAALLAVGLGARVIEKHFTLDQHYSDFRDHQLSADPTMLKELVNRVRQSECLLGILDKQVQPCAAELAIAIRRSIAVKQDLQVGEILTDQDLIWNRPGAGLPPGSEFLVVGKTLKQPVRAGQQLTQSDVE
ncbi:MAG: N-acetylneuraminate synthase family protein [Cyanobacteria bacterium]|nr:N-acetylneuraminate synthase family protein [Cyanobacteriota bacterium]